MSKNRSKKLSMASMTRIAGEVSMSDFKRYWGKYESENYVLGSEEYCAQQAWNHQQSKLDEVQRVIDIYEDGDIDSLSDFARYVKQALRGEHE